MNPILKQQLPRCTVGAWHLSTQKALVIALMLSFIFSGCKKKNLGDDAPGSQLSGSANLKTNTAPADFMIAVIPDTQYYVDSASLSLHDHGGTLPMFQAQITWIKNHQVDSNIVYVVGLGDITDHGDSTSRYPGEWEKANNLYTQLESPLTGLPNGIPYGLAVGNHDQNPYGQPITGTTTKFNTNFGVSRYTGRAYYGGHYGTNNDSHYDLFTAGGLDFIVIYIEYDNDASGGEDTQGAVNTWAYNLLGTYSSRKAIIVSHAIIPNSGVFYNQGQRIYNRLRSRKNVFLMLCGHAPGKGAQRWDTYNGNTIKTMLSDYQINSYRGAGVPQDGGNGLMRLMRFSVANDIIAVRTYSPYANIYITNRDTSEFTRPLFHHETAMRTCDFNKDGKTELSFFNAGKWKVNGMSDVQYGATTDIPVNMDYNGDGKTDYCDFRPSNGTWYTNGVKPNKVFGDGTDIPVPGDYSGDGKADFAYYRPSSGYYHWDGEVAATNVQGNATDIPVPGDYDGDGKADYVIYRRSDSTHYHIYYNAGGSTTSTYGESTDIPVPGDYDGDGITDLAVFRPGTGQWYMEGITGSGSIICVTKATGDQPAPGDYDGLGRTQPAIYRPSNHTLYIYHWSTGTVTTVNYASSASGDKLLNLPYCIRKFFFP